MYILVVYDINFDDDNGKNRLRKVAKLCEDYGIRVQNSVFELNIDNTKYMELKNKLKKEIAEDKDSIRFYKLGKNINNSLEIIGKESNIEITQSTTFIF